jgi:predicted PurR-regulated permease PerM
VIQAAENNFIVPYIMRRAAGIQPLTTIVLILLGFRFGSIAGAFIIVPLYIVSRTILSEFNHEIKEITERE